MVRVNSGQTLLPKVRALVNQPLPLPAPSYAYGKLWSKAEKVLKSVPDTNIFQQSNTKQPPKAHSNTTLK